MANGREIPEEDVLADRGHRYRRETGTVTIAVEKEKMEKRREGEIWNRNLKRSKK